MEKRKRVTTSTMVKGSCWQSCHRAEHEWRCGEKSNSWDCLSVWEATSRTGGESGERGCGSADWLWGFTQGDQPCEMMHVPHQGMQPYGYHDVQFEQPFPIGQDQITFEIDLGVDEANSNALDPRAVMSAVVDGQMEMFDGVERVEQTPMESKQQGWKEVRSHETFVTKETEASFVAHPRAEGGQGWDCNGAPTLQSTERPKPGPADFGTLEQDQRQPSDQEGAFQPCALLGGGKRGWQEEIWVDGREEAEDLNADDAAQSAQHNRHLDVPKPGVSDTPAFDTSPDDGQAATMMTGPCAILGGGKRDKPYEEDQILEDDDIQYGERTTPGHLRDRLVVLQERAFEAIRALPVQCDEDYEFGQVETRIWGLEALKHVLHCNPTSC